MKAQYRILEEILIFSLGIAIVSFVMINFQHLHDSMSGVAIESQLTSVSNMLTAAIIKSSLSNNSVIRMSIPETISDNEYQIKIADSGGRTCNVGDECLLKLSCTDTIISQRLFNISQTHNIIGNVVSGSRYIRIVSNSTDIVVERDED
ncbi:MAG: hypothetical protein V1900_02520 [Candidatus Aenigmatarchaeota archaeon]